MHGTTAPINSVLKNCPWSGNHIFEGHLLTLILAIIPLQLTFITFSHIITLIIYRLTDIFTDWPAEYPTCPCFSPSVTHFTSYHIYSVYLRYQQIMWRQVCGHLSMGDDDLQVAIASINNILICQVSHMFSRSTNSNIYEQKSFSLIRFDPSYKCKSFTSPPHIYHFVTDTTEVSHLMHTSAPEVHISECYKAFWPCWSVNHVSYFGCSFLPPWFCLLYIIWEKPTLKIRRTLTPNLKVYVVGIWSRKGILYYCIWEYIIWKCFFVCLFSSLIPLIPMFAHRHPPPTCQVQYCPMIINTGYKQEVFDTCFCSIISCKKYSTAGQC